MDRNKALVGVLLVCALPAAAATDNACWNRDLERMDFYTNFPSRGDNNFFSFTVSGTANVTMIYPATLSMKALPVSLYELRQPSVAGATSVAAGSGLGCSNAYLNNLSYFMPSDVDAPHAAPQYLGGYDPTKYYPDPETTYAGGGGIADGFETTTAYNTAKSDKNGGLAWLYMQWPANDSGTAVGTNPNVGTIDASCSSALGFASGLDYQDCQLCVKTKGYWINYLKASLTDTSPGVMVVKGNWLNFYPPKWALLRLAYKRLVNGPLLNPLREGIGTQNGEQGWYRLQKMLPQSCSGQGRPNQRISSVDGVKYTNTSNPLAEMLFNVAWTVSSIDSTPPSSWPFFSSASTHPASEPGASSDANKKAGFCPGCNAGFSVIFSDGRGIDGLTNCDSSSGAILPGYCTRDSKAACSGSTATGQPGLGLGAEKDGDQFLDPNIAGGAGALISGAGATYSTANVAPSGVSVCANDWLPGVAAWMFNTNLGGQPGTNLRLYTVGIGDNYFGELNTLKAAASAGHGMFLSAANFATLERNISNVFLDIISKATSFSVAAITTVQTRGTTFAFIPRFRPLGGSQWEGRLYRFSLYNEFSAGCAQTELTGGPDGGPLKDALNPNGNASCTDLYLQDADGGFVAEDDGGTFVLLDNTQPWSADAGWPIRSPKTAATPIWEAASLLTVREAAVASDAGGSTYTARNILIAPLDAGTPAVGSSLIRYNDFSAANVATMTDYMKLSGVNSDFCTGLESTTRHVYATEQDCGQDLMKFVEGQDVLRQNTDGGVARPNILGDIFHSSPILVTPPVIPGLCELGIVNQCVRTLYQQDLDGQGRQAYTPNSTAAYNTWLNAKKTRQELILVGANDGMLHAFQAGTALPDGGGYDDGTGAEVWAFIPSDQLPKLQRYALSESHNILVDGTPWVRDIWKDGSGSGTANRQKDADEFHTIAVIGEREGGRHYYALDVTDTSGNPKFLWRWPPPGSVYDLTEGESWNDTTPEPPPIGPILMADPSGPIPMTVPASGGGTSTVQASERWVVAISGGFDPNYIRGRAVYILDAWDGTLLYKFSRYDTGNASDPRYLLGSVAAPAGLIDTDFNNFFDVAVVGDTDGQLWTIDMLNPGSMSGGLVTNWFGGLTFQQFKGNAMAKRAPFFALAASRPGLDNYNTRVYVGSGDRDQIKVRDTDAIDGGTCTVDNLRGCIRNDCNVDVSQTIYQVGGSTNEAFTGEWRYGSGQSALTTNTFTVGGTDGTAGACNDPAQVNIQYTVSCGTAKWPNPDGGTDLTTVSNTMNCDFDGGTDAGEECLDTSGKPLDQPGIAFNSPSTITNTRFYAFNLFDAPGYALRPRMVDSTSQATYNAHTLSDSDLANGDLPGGLSDGGVGYYIQHSRDLNEKTASGALVLGGCILWNTEVPSVLFQGTGADGGAVCQGGTIPADTAYLYQADEKTGVAQCGLAGSATQLVTQRYSVRPVTVTPQEPTPVVSVNSKTGMAAYSGISLEPGAKFPLNVGVGAQGVQGDVAWTDVSRVLHNCRHPARYADGGVATPVCVN